QLLQLLHGALDRLARERAELLGRFLERARADLERDRQRAGRREDLRFADVDHRARLVAPTVLVYRREAPDRAHAPIGEDLLEVELLRVDLDVVRGFGFGSHTPILAPRDQLPGLIVHEGLLDLLLRAHHERAVGHYRLADRLAGEQQPA